MEIIRPLSIGTTTNSTNILVSFYRVRTIIGLVEPNSYTPSLEFHLQDEFSKAPSSQNESPDEYLLMNSLFVQKQNKTIMEHNNLSLFHSNNCVPTLPHGRVMHKSNEMHCHAKGGNDTKCTSNH